MFLNSSKAFYQTGCHHPLLPLCTVTSSAGAALRLSSLRQLSNTFASTLRTKKPLSRKDAININKWRFSKLRENIEGDIEIKVFGAAHAALLASSGPQSWSAYAGAPRFKRTTELERAL